MIAALMILGKTKTCKTTLFNAVDTRGYDYRRLFKDLRIFKDYNPSDKELKISEQGKELFDLIKNTSGYNKKLNLILLNLNPHYNELNTIALEQGEKTLKIEELFIILRNRLLAKNYDLSEPTFKTVQGFGKLTNLIEIKDGMVSFNQLSNYTLEEIINKIDELTSKYIEFRQFEKNLEKCETSHYIDYLLKEFPSYFELTKADCMEIITQHKDELKLKFGMGVGDEIIPNIRAIINFEERD